MKSLLHLTLLVLSFFLITCAGDIKGEKGDPPSFLSIRGGGKISWNAADSKATFTKNLIITNLRNGITTTISASASPLTFGSAEDLAYVTLNEEKKADPITDLKVVAMGEVPTGPDIVILFQRTSDDTLLIPQVQKELLTGDHWQFGSTQSWFERRASYAKPSFNSVAGDTSLVAVPGSASNPAAVYIDGKLFANRSIVTLDLDTPGRKGLDTGTKAVGTMYYLYAIPPTEGRGFDIVSSVSAPSEDGPTGFNSWSYLGAFTTARASTVIPKFISTSGTNMRDDHRNSITASTVFERQEVQLPVTARFVIGELGLIVNGSAGFVAASPTQNPATGDQALYHEVGATSGNWFAQTTIPILEPQTIYLLTSDLGNVAYFQEYGWREDPMEWR